MISLCLICVSIVITSNEINNLYLYMYSHSNKYSIDYLFNKKTNQVYHPIKSNQSDHFFHTKHLSSLQSQSRLKLLSSLFL